jgi:hypothetical protein
MLFLSDFQAKQPLKPPRVASGELIDELHISCFFDDEISWLNFNLYTFAE